MPRATPSASTHDTALAQLLDALVYITVKVFWAFRATRRRYHCLYPSSDLTKCVCECRRARVNERSCVHVCARTCMRACVGERERERFVSHCVELALGGNKCTGI